jgi:hypothetical protein
MTTNFDSKKTKVQQTYPSQYDVISRELKQQGIEQDPRSSQVSAEKSKSKFVFPHEPGRESAIQHLIGKAEKQ